MNEGLLWFDNDPKRPLADKIKQAAVRYQQKFGLIPTACYLNPITYDGQAEAVDGVKLTTANNIRPNHFWVGIE